MSFYFFGEDEKYEIYKKNSEVYTNQDNPEPYLQLLEQKQEYFVTGLSKEIIIKQKTVEKLLLLSGNDPLEHVLFSFCKTINKDDLNKYPIQKEMEEGEILIDEKGVSDKPTKLRSGRKPNKKRPNKGEPFTDADSSNDSDNANYPLKKGENNKDSISIDVKNSNLIDPLSQSGSLISSSSYNSNNNQENKNSNVINIPEPKDEVKPGYYSENGEINVGLSPNAVTVKWFYLTLVLCGICDAAYFFYTLRKEEIPFSFCLLFCGLLGIFLIFTGIFGFCKINSRVYDNIFLLIITILAIIGALASLCLFRLNELKIISENLFPAIIVNALTVIFAIICIILTHKLKVEANLVKQKQEIKLIDQPLEEK